ncbi:MAG: hypothetical protein Rpha_0332 [Candidatus Ruthia sp. Apha_13_S6]|nr:hypothetical protein [Candidatus Ruthia sp. Apha_13_S6]
MMKTMQMANTRLIELIMLIIRLGLFYEDREDDIKTKFKNRNY